MPEQIEVVKTLAISTILRDADELPTIAEKVALLKKYDNNQIREIIRHAFEPSIKYGVSTDPVPCDALDYSRETNNDPSQYRPNHDLGLNDGTLYFEVRKRLIYLIEGGPGDVMTQAKRDDLFKDILEAVNPGDAELLLAIKNKTWPYASLTPTVINEAYPSTISLDAGIAAVVNTDKTKPPAKKKAARKSTGVGVKKAVKKAPAKKAAKKTA